MSDAERSEAAPARLPSSSQGEGPGVGAGTGARVARNSAALTVAALLSKGGGLVVAVLVARYLGPSAQGTYAVVMGIALLLEQVAPIGLPIVVLRAVAQDRQRLMPYWVNGSLLAFVSAALLSVLLVLSARLLGLGPEAKTSVYFVALYLPLAGLSAIAQATVQGLEQMDQVIWSAFVGRALSLLVLWLMLELGIGVEAAFASYVVFHLVSTLVLAGLMLRKEGWSTALHTPSARPDLGLCRSALRISVPFALQALLVNASSRLNAALLSLFVALDSVGLFDAADRIRDTGASIIPIVNLAILPTLARTFTSDRPTAVRLSAKAVKLLLMAILPFVIGVALAADWVIRLLYGPGYEAAARVLQVVIWSLLFFVPDAILNQVLIATGNERAMVRRTAAALAANVLLILLLAPRWGAVGAAWAIVLSTALKLGADAWYVRRHVARLGLAGVVGKLALCAAAAGAAGYLLRNLALIPMLLVFLAVYGILVWILRVPAHDELALLRHLLARLWGKLIAPLAGRKPSTRGIQPDDRPAMTNPHAAARLARNGSSTDARSIGPCARSRHRLLRPGIHTRHRKAYLYALTLAIVWLAFLLRTSGLASNASFSTDEVTTVSHSMRPLAEIPRLESKTPLQALWIRFGARYAGLGTGEFSVFFLSAISGVLAVALIYRLGRSLFGSGVGRLSAFVLAFSAYHLYWSQSARYYASMVLLSAGAYLCLYLGLTTGRRWVWVGYALLRSLSLYNHLTALLLLPGEVAFALAYLALPTLRRLVSRRKARPAHTDARSIGPCARREGPCARLRRTIAGSRFAWWMVSMALIVLAFSPVLYALALDVYMGSSVFRVGDVSSEQLVPRETRTSQPQPLLGGGLGGPFLVLRLLDAWNTPLHVLMIAGVVLGVACCLRRRQWTQLLFAGTLLVVPFVLAAGIKSYALVLDGRYLISLLPVYLVIACRGVWGLAQAGAGLARRIGPCARRLNQAVCGRIGLPQSWSMVHRPWAMRLSVAQGLVAAFVLAYVGLSWTRISLSWSTTTGQNWRSVAHFLDRNADREVPIVVSGLPTLTEGLQYYLPGHNVVRLDPRLSLADVVQQEQEVWFVFQPGTDMYTGQRYWADAYKAVTLVFAGGWYPDIANNSPLAPAQNWDLYVVYINRGIPSAEAAFEQLEEWLAQAEALEPGAVRRELTLAEAYRRAGQSTRAVNAFSRALEEGYVNDQLASYILDVRAQAWLGLGRTGRAYADWQAAIERTPWSSEPHARLGQALLQAGSPDEAEALYQRAAAANPGKAWPHVLLGGHYQARGHKQEAITAYRRAVEVQPGHPLAYQRLAEIYAASNDRTRIVALLQEAIQSNPWAGWPHSLLGQHYQSWGKTLEAVAEYQRAVERQPELTPSVSGLLRKARWSLAGSLDAAQVYSDRYELVWWPGSAWARPYPYAPDVLVGPSSVTVGGRLRADQLLLHPFGNEERTYIAFEVPYNSFSTLTAGYGLADDVAGKSNGVDFAVEVREKGAARYEPLIAVEVTKNAWREQTVSLVPYWGKELEFRLAVDARGEADFDWLQVVVRLAPLPRPIWDLSANLSAARVDAGEEPLVRRQSGFFGADGRLVVGASADLVESPRLERVVEFRPSAAGLDSTAVFTLSTFSYQALATSFALPEGAANPSAGVEYAVEVSLDGGESFERLLEATVTTESWQSTIQSLIPSPSLVLRLSAFSGGGAAPEGLRVKLALLPSAVRRSKLSTAAAGAGP